MDAQQEGTQHAHTTTRHHEQAATAAGKSGGGAEGREEAMADDARCRVLGGKGGREAAPFDEGNGGRAKQLPRSHSVDPWEAPDPESPGGGDSNKRTPPRKGQRRTDSNGNSGNNGNRGGEEARRGEWRGGMGEGEGQRPEGSVSSDVVKRGESQVKLECQVEVFRFFRFFSAVPREGGRRREGAEMREAR